MLNQTYLISCTYLYCPIFVNQNNCNIFQTTCDRSASKTYKSILIETASGSKSIFLPITLMSPYLSCHPFYQMTFYPLSAELACLENLLITSDLFQLNIRDLDLGRREQFFVANGNMRQCQRLPSINQINAIFRILLSQILILLKLGALTYEI